MTQPNNKCRAGAGQEKIKKKKLHWDQSCDGKDLWKNTDTSREQHSTSSCQKERKKRKPKHNRVRMNNIISIIISVRVSVSEKEKDQHCIVMVEIHQINRGDVGVTSDNPYLTADRQMKWLCVYVFKCFC